MTRNTLFVAPLAALLVVSSCKKSDKPAENAQGFQQGQPGTSQPPQGQPGTAPQGTPGPAPSGTGAASQPGQVPALGAILSDPNTLQGIVAGALAGAAASLGGVTGGELGPIQAGIKNQAQTNAKGMKPEGQLFSAKLQQDGHAQGTVTLAPGACYTIIGFAGLGVFQYQMNLITEPPLPPQVLAQSAADGPAPVIGPNEQCVKNPYPLPMTVKIDMHVIRGQGMAGAQAYRK